MDKFKKRQNGTGTVVFLGKGRYKPYASRLLIGKDKFGKPIYFDLDTFETELDALVNLENWTKNPYPLKINRTKYDRLETFTCFPHTDTPYPLVPVSSKKSTIHRKDKTNYTFKQVFEEMKELLFPTPEEIHIERTLHIKPEGKFARKNASNMITAYNKSVSLYDIIYRELHLSDFKSCVNSPDISKSTKLEMVKLYKHMDKYAYSEDIISKKYTENLQAPSVSHDSRSPFTYDEIEYLWNIKESDFRLQFVRDFLLLTIYTGCRAEELLFTYTKNIFLDKEYFVTGLKTEAGKNRIIPIHPEIMHIIKKYFNKNNEFLFMSERGIRTSYSMYGRYYRIFANKYTGINGKTAHCGRHSLETELKKINIKSQIVNSILGHKNGNVGDDIYNDITTEQKISVMKLITYKETKIYLFNNEQKIS